MQREVSVIILVYRRPSRVLPIAEGPSWNIKLVAKNQTIR